MAVTWTENAVNQMVDKFDHLENKAVRRRHRARCGGSSLVGPYRGGGGAGSNEWIGVLDQSLAPCQIGSMTVYKQEGLGCYEPLTPPQMLTVINMTDDDLIAGVGGPLMKASRVNNCEILEVFPRQIEDCAPISTVEI